MAQNVLVLGAIAIMGFCIWVRRETWRIPQDAALTLAVAFLAAGLLFTLPAHCGGHAFGALVYGIVGITHVRDLAGHLCFLCAAGAVNYALVSRLVPDDKIGVVMKRIERPSATAAAVMAGAMITDPQLRHPIALDFFNIPVDPHLAVYWLALIGALLHQFIFGIRMLRILRQDPRSRTTANIFLIAAAIGISSIVAMLFQLAYPGHVPAIALWMGLCVPGSFVAACAARSWIKRQHRESPRDSNFP